MAKPPPVQRFRISCEVEAAHLGPIIAQLTMMGLTKVTFDLITDVRSFAQNKRPEVSSRDFLAEWIKEHPTFRAIEAVKAFEADGRSKGACYPMLGHFIEQRLLKKTGPGEYARTDIKAALKKKQKKKTNKHYDVPNSDFLLRAARRNHGRFTSASIKKLFEADKRPVTGVGPTINRLRQDGLVKQLGDGAYELTARANKPAKPTNGGAEVVTNG